MRDRLLDLVAWTVLVAGIVVLVLAGLGFLFALAMLGWVVWVEPNAVIVLLSLIPIFLAIFAGVTAFEWARWRLGK